VLGVTSLGMRERVAVLRVRDRTLLVGVTAAQITLLANLDAPSRPAATVTTTALVE
jgi:flagellar biogenesis protein FliO